MTPRFWVRSLLDLAEVLSGDIEARGGPGSVPNNPCPLSDVVSTFLKGAESATAGVPDLGIHFS